VKKKLFAMFIILSGSTVGAQNPNERFFIMPYLGVQSYRWEEFDNDGQRLVKETGPRYSLGATSRLSFLPSKSLFAELDLRYTLDTVDYDGVLITQQGLRIPYSTKTAYCAVEGTLTIGYSFKLFRTLLFTPVAGFGSEYWTRNLDYRGPYGYTERFLAPSAGAGIRLTYTPNKVFQMFSATTLSMPVAVSESFTIAPQGQGPMKLVLHPGINPRFKAEAGGSLYRVSVIFSFETWTLSRSDTDWLYYQPKSIRREFGMRIGYSIVLAQ
jgi:hypothetical protein